jgi:glycosyltransferase involved in cell wall biosynthesis
MNDEQARGPRGDERRGAGCADDGYLFVLPWEPASASGVNQVVLNLFHEFEAHGRMRPLLLIQSWKHAEPETEHVGKRTYIRFRIRSPESASGSLRSFVAYWLLLPLELWKLWRVLRVNDVVVVNVHYPGLSVTSFSLLKLMGAYRGRLVLTFHGLDFKLAAEAEGWRRALWTWNGLRADAITACSQALADELIDRFPEWKDRVRAIHNGLDVERFVAEAEVATELDSMLKGTRFILNVGTYEAKKGQDVLIRAFERIASRFPDVLLVLVGNMGPTRLALGALVAELRLTERVIFRENVDHANIGAYYRNATVFAMPSRNEPFGIAILEAAAFGVPIVASRVGGVPEIIASPRCGMLVEPDDPAQLGQALERLLADPAQASAIGTCLRQHVIECLSWTVAYREYLSCGAEE